MYLASRETKVSTIKKNFLSFLARIAGYRNFSSLSTSSYPFSIFFISIGAGERGWISDISLGRQSERTRGVEPI